MYPFRILMVKKDSTIYYRVIYQKEKPNMELQVNGRTLCIDCAAVPEIILSLFDGNFNNIYLRGYCSDSDHKVKILFDIHGLNETYIKELNHELSLQSING